jgi:hypothetical protein
MTWGNCWSTLLQQCELGSLAHFVANNGDRFLEPTVATVNKGLVEAHCNNEPRPLLDHCCNNDLRSHYWKCPQILLSPFAPLLCCNYDRIIAAMPSDTIDAFVGYHTDVSARDVAWRTPYEFQRTRKSTPFELHSSVSKKSPYGPICVCLSLHFAVFPRTYATTMVSLRGWIPRVLPSPHKLQDSAPGFASVGPCLFAPLACITLGLCPQALLSVSFTPRPCLCWVGNPWASVTSS